jgi:hypothetical protein
MNPGRIRRVTAIAIGLLSAALAACTGVAGRSSTVTPGVPLVPDTPHIEVATLDRLYSSAGSYLQTSGDLEVVAFRRTVRILVPAISVLCGRRMPP